jgi:20S proteasome subunit beta 5
MYSENFGLPSSFNYTTKETERPLLAESNFDSTFEMPNIQDPSQFIKTLKASDNQDNKKLTDFKKGTTTLAFVFKEGVLVAVDSRAS